MTVKRSGLGVVDLILVAKNVTALSIPSGINEDVTEVVHGLSARPVVEYKISLDGEDYYPPPFFSNFSAELARYAIYAYTDRTKLYLHFIYMDSVTLASSTTLYVSWRLYLTENSV